jgi:hypothetical protein
VVIGLPHAYFEAGAPQFEAVAPRQVRRPARLGTGHGGASRAMLSGSVSGEEQ